MGNWFPSRFEPYSEPTGVITCTNGYLTTSNTATKLYHYKDITSLCTETPFYDEILYGWIKWLNRSKAEELI